MGDFYVANCSLSYLNCILMERNIQTNVLSVAVTEILFLISELFI